MGRFRKNWLAGSLSIYLLLSACTSSPAPPETPTPLESWYEASTDPTAEMTPEPTPEPSPTPDPQALLDILEQTDIFAYIASDLYTRGEGQRWYEPVLAKPGETLALPAAYANWLEAATEQLKDHGISEVSAEIEAPSWPLLAALISNYSSDPETLRATLVQAGGLHCEVVPAESGFRAVVSASPPDITSLVYGLPATEDTDPFSLMTSYAYLSTVFDENMTAREGVGTPELEPLLFPIVNPDRYFVGDCWAQPRDGGGRLHTGIDINAPEGTDLLAVTDGTILDNGYNSVAGNFVVLRAQDGTQYHYYHLVEPSDLPPGTTVARGDVVGHVGSTGNSRANHLHLTIVTADGHYVNPFTYMQKAQQDTIAAAG